MRRFARLRGVLHAEARYGCAPLPLRLCRHAAVATTLRDYTVCRQHDGFCPLRMLMTDAP